MTDSARASEPSFEVRPSFAQRRRAARRVLVRALGVSALLHIGLLLLYPSMTAPPGASFAPGGSDAPPSEEGLQLLALRELPPGREPDPVGLRPLPEPERSVGLVGGIPTGGGAGGGAASEEEDVEPARLRTAAELLRPGPLDPEFLGPIELPPLSDEERYRLQLAGRLQQWEDSVRAELERERRVTDWTRTDAEGNRWGVSPGQLHLGKFSLPLPFQFATPPGQRDAIERRNWESAEIRRGAVEAEIRGVQGDRAREIRARREAERADTIPSPR